ncbi:MAG: hypothetical protein DRH23_06545 [Deltaproteobacteria bacterium]|nr:tetratricopeptide repeat protein [Deltaproteobacteria bacterium]MBW2717712.1 tetratricopeptide repeat protein [Deltaproteobacteria bacterium]RLB49477.1 MAG: hypothetical protein DRH23_06545 [Deltaproteobacteria bacterium]
MSDFGFDAYALDDAEPIGQPHPLEIARDLIEAGRPRAALEMLSVHHDELVDDPEYLLLCSAAWRADGDSLRAQQALLGAARIAPKDPRPLLGLGDLLAERGEHDKAALVLQKARALEAVVARPEEAPEGLGPDAGDDLIAFAEQRERGNQSAFTPRQVLFVVGALGGVALLITGIAMLTSTPDEVSAAPTDEISAEPTAIEPVEAELIREPLHEPEVVVAPPIAEPAVAAEVPEPEPKPATPVSKPPRKSTSSRRAVPTRRAVPAPTPEPQAAVVQAELASLDAQQLTARADALYLQGHTGVGASYYRRALELDPDYAPALVGMGRSILRAKKYSEAMRNASRALQLARGVDARPGLEAAAIYQMGRVHYERGERDAARRLFRQSISLRGTPPEAWFYLGEALSSDNSPAARDAYERYLELVAEGHLAERARRAIR